MPYRGPRVLHPSQYKYNPFADQFLDENGQPGAPAPELPEAPDGPGPMGPDLGLVPEPPSPKPPTTQDVMDRMSKAAKDAADFNTSRDATYPLSPERKFAKEQAGLGSRGLSPAGVAREVGGNITSHIGDTGNPLLNAINEAVGEDSHIQAGLNTRVGQAATSLGGSELERALPEGTPGVIKTGVGLAPMFVLPELAGTSGASRAAVARRIAARTATATGAQTGLEEAGVDPTLAGLAAFQAPGLAEGVAGRVGRAAAAVRAGNAAPEVYRVAVSPGGVALPQDTGFAASRGAVQVADSARVRVLEPGEEPAAGETVMYHGSTQGAVQGELKPGTFLTADAGDAQSYAEVTAAIARAKNPLRKPAAFLGRLAASESGAIGPGAEGAYPFGPKGAPGQTGDVGGEPEADKLFGRQRQVRLDDSGTPIVTPPPAAAPARPSEFQVKHLGQTIDSLKTQIRGDGNISQLQPRVDELTQQWLDMLPVGTKLTTGDLKGTVVNQAADGLHVRWVDPEGRILDRALEPEDAWQIGVAAPDAAGHPVVPPDAHGPERGNESYGSLPKPPTTGPKAAPAKTNWIVETMEGNDLTLPAANAAEARQLAKDAGYTVYKIRKGESDIYKQWHEGDQAPAAEPGTGELPAKSPETSGSTLENPPASTPPALPGQTAPRDRSVPYGALTQGERDLVNAIPKKTRMALPLSAPLATIKQYLEAAGIRSDGTKGDIVSRYAELRGGKKIAGIQETLGEGDIFGTGADQSAEEAVAARRTVAGAKGGATTQLRNKLQQSLDFLKSEQGSVTLPGFGEEEAPQPAPNGGLLLTSADISYRPDLFQTRDTTPGKPYNEQRVQDITASFDPGQFTPPKVVADPANPGKYILMEGQHRTPAWQAATGDQPMPARLAPYDIRDPQQLARAQLEADQSNTTTRALNVREEIRNLQRIDAAGETNEQAVARLGKTPGYVAKLRGITNLGEAAADRVVQDPALFEHAATIGMAADRYHLTGEDAAGLFNRIASNPKDRPTISALTETLKKYGSALAGASQGALFNVEEFGGSRGTLLDLIDRNARVQSQLNGELARVKLQMKATGTLAGADPEAMKAAAQLQQIGQTRVDALQAEMSANEADALRALEQTRQENAQQRLAAAQGGGGGPPSAPTATGAEPGPREPRGDIATSRGAYQPAMDGEWTPQSAEDLTGPLGGNPPAEAAQRPGLARRALTELLGFAGLPQTIAAGGDLSAGFRQGGILGASHPGIWRDAMVAQAKAYVSREAAMAANAAVNSSKWFNFATSEAIGLKNYEWGRDVAPGERVPGYTGINESWVGKKSGNLPLIANGERAYATMLNVEGMAVFEKYADAMWANGERSVKAYRDLADVINHARGYGTGSVAKFAAGTHAFFSGRNLVSRFQVIADPFIKSGSLLEPSARQLAAKNMLAFFGGNVALLGFLGLTGAMAGGAWSVNANPNSGDFAKLRIGNLRIDTLGGFAPLGRLIAREGGYAVDQAGLGTHLAPANFSPKQALLSFFRNKEAPIPALMTDVLSGQDALGKKITLSPERLAQMFEPFIAEDVISAVQQNQGANKLLAIPAAAASVVGLGASSYRNQGDYRNEEAQRRGLGDFESIQDYGTRKSIDQTIKDQGNAFVPTGEAAHLEQANKDIADELATKQKAFMAGANDKKLSDYIGAATQQRIGLGKVRSAYFDELGIEPSSDFAKRLNGVLGDPGDKKNEPSGYLGLRAKASDEFSQTDYDALKKLQTEYTADLPAADQKLLKGYLDYTESQKTPLEKRLDTFRTNKETAGYYADNADTTALDKAHADLDVEGWYFGFLKSKDGPTAPALQSREAVDQALALSKSESLKGRPVKLAGYTRPVNQDAESLRAYQDSRQLLASYDNPPKKVLEEERQYLASGNAEYDKPWDQLSPSARATVLSNVHQQKQLDRPDIDAWLAWWGAERTYHSDEALAALKKLQAKYGKTLPAPKFVLKPAANLE